VTVADVPDPFFNADWHALSEVQTTPFMVVMMFAESVVELRVAAAAVIAFTVLVRGFVALRLIDRTRVPVATAYDS
jgi:hypothetical protein